MPLARRAAVASLVPVLILTVVVLAHAAAVVAVFRIDGRPDGPELITRIVVSWATFGVALAVLLRVRLTRPVLTVAVVGALLMLPGVAAEPQTSTDSYRYIWDGRVQLAGVSPYAYAPRDEALRGLRDDYLWPDGPDGRTRIGKSAVPTIYPPVAQAWFTAVAAVFGPWADGWGLRIATAALAVAVTVLLGRLLARTGRDPRWSAVWAWSPLVLYEAGNNAHVDVVAVALVVVAFGALHAGRHVLAGVALGLGIATKVVPLVVAPVFARERPLRTGLAAVAAIVLPYVPHVLAVGPAVLGYLPGYLAEEGYDGTKRFRLVGAVAPEAATVWLAVALSLALAVVAWRVADPRRPWDAATWLSGSALLIVSPTYHWYALILVACVALSRRWEWLCLPVAVYAVYLAPNYYGFSGPLQLRLYTACLAVVIVVGVLRWASRRARSPIDVGRSA